MYLKICVNLVNVWVVLNYGCAESIVPLSSAKNKETKNKMTTIKPKGILGMFKTTTNIHLYIYLYKYQ